jgi:DNA polymerase I-like protein with 3'-5' exonuclease and polymerase domains
MEAIAIAKTPEAQGEARRAKEKEEEQIKRWAGNQPIQSSCVDILKPAMVKIYLALRGDSWTGELLYDAHFLLTAHDEIVMEAREDQAKAVAQIMKDCMQEAYNDVAKSVTLGPVDVTISDYWEK